MGSDQQQQQPPIQASTSITHDSTKTIRRACDCCRKRKVRCDGAEPCGPCKKALIRCAYLQPPKKKGPKGLRSARVLHALRRVDDNAGGHHDTQSDLEHHGTFGNWGWNSQNSSPIAIAPPHLNEVPVPPDTGGGVSQPNITQNQGYFTSAIPVSYTHLTLPTKRIV